MAALKIVVLITHWFYLGEVYSLESSLIIFCVLFLEVSWMRESREQAAIPHFEFSIWCARPAFWLQRLFPTEIQCSIAGRNRTVKPTCLGEGGNSRKRMCKYCITNVLHKAPLPEKMLCRSYFFILPPFTPSFCFKDYFGWSDEQHWRSICLGFYSCADGRTQHSQTGKREYTLHCRPANSDCSQMY